MSEIRSVDLPVLRCPICETAYVLRLPLFIMGGDPEWVYQPDCKHKPVGSHVETDSMEFARIAAASVPSPPAGAQK